MTMSQPITIIGAGIGGLTTALMLKQCGFPVQIFEAAPEIKPVGAGIVLANNAMQVFQTLGLQQRIESAGNRMAVMKITDEKLNPLSAMKPEKFEQQYGVCNIAIHRADLQKILADAIGMDNIHLSKRLTTVEKGNAFRLYFDDGSRINSEVLIGADGIRSVIRQSFFPHTIIRDTGQVCWRGICETELPENDQHHAVEAWGKGKRFGVTQLGGKKIYWYAVVNERLVKMQDPLRELFREFPPLLLNMIEQTPDSDIYFSGIADIKPVNRWAEGKMCLIGDAAHATTPNLGQGACQAVEDAYALGVLLSSGSTVEGAFKLYEKIRMKKAHAIVNRSRTLGQIAHIENGAGRWLRDMLMKLTPSSAADRQLRWLFDISYIDRLADR